MADGEANRAETGAGPTQEDLQTRRQARYREWLGTPVYIWHEDRAVVPRIDLHVYPPAPEIGRESYTVITSGMSDARMSVPSGVNSPDRLELIQYVTEFDRASMTDHLPWYAATMLYLAHYPFAYRTWLGPLHTIPNGEPPAPLSSGSLLVAALFLEARFEPAGFREGLCWQDQQVGFLWLTFITRAELNYKLEKGGDALVAKLEEQHLPKVLEPLRPPLVPEEWRRQG